MTRKTKKKRHPNACKHYWQACGAPGTTWHSSRALGRCLNCPSWTVLQYGHIGPGDNIITNDKPPTPRELLRAFSYAFDIPDISEPFSSLLKRVQEAYPEDDTDTETATED